MIDVATTQPKERLRSSQPPGWVWECLPLRILTASIGFFGGWTVGSNIVSLAQLPFDFLYGALLLAFAAAWWCTLKAPALYFDLVRANLIVIGDRQKPLRFIEFVSGPSARLAALVLVGAAIGIFFFVRQSTFWPLWIAALACVAAAAWMTPREVPEAGVLHSKANTFDAGGIPHLPFLALTLVIIALYVLLLKPDGDDAFYLNLPIGILQAPESVMERDTMHGALTWPLLMPTYRAESLPTLVAMLASVTGIPVRYVSHGLLPIAWCVSFAAALQVIGGTLFGRQWFVFSLFTIAVFLGLGGSLQGYASHGIVRFFHGKGPLIAIVVPLITLFAVAAARKPSWALLWMLAALQISAVGLTANGIYVAPLTLGIATASVLLSAPTVRQLQWRALMPLLTSIYPIGIGIVLLVLTPPFGVEEGLLPSIANDFWMTFPRSYVLAVAIGSVFLSLSVGLSLCATRILPVYIGLVFLLIFNPFLWNAYADYVTGNLNYRLFWVVPVPMLIAGILTVAWNHLGHLFKILPMIAAAALLSGPASMLRGENGARFEPSLVKVPSEILAAVQRVNELTPLDTRILADRDLALWIPTVENHRYPVVVRDDYLDVFAGRVDGNELSERRMLLRWVSGERGVIALPQLRVLSEKYCVGTIAIDSTRSNRDVLTGEVISLGGLLVAREGRFVLFRLTTSSTPCRLLAGS